jgi:hypothetical protein
MAAMDAMSLERHRADCIVLVGVSANTLALPVRKSERDRLALLAHDRVNRMVWLYQVLAHSSCVAYLGTGGEAEVLGLAVNEARPP